jgi:hypothetical protein
VGWEARGGDFNSCGAKQAFFGISFQNIHLNWRKSGTIWARIWTEISRKNIF